jgi:hypothetical protein
MKRFIFLSFLLVFFFKPGLPQGCLPEGITFETQEQINNFQANYPGCTEIEGDVFIGSENGNLNIMNLQGLSCLVKIDGRLDIIGCNSIGELSGLNSLTEVGGSMEINSCTELDNLSGLNSLTHVGGGFKIALNNILTSIEALESLTAINGDLSIVSNVTLHSLAGLNSLIVVPGSIYLSHNSYLTDITALQNINADSLQGFIAIMSNSNLSECAKQSVCAYIQTPGGLVFINNNAVGCNNLNEVQQDCLTSIETHSGQAEISLIPNPASSFIAIHIKEYIPIEEAIIYNHLGKKVLEKRPVNNMVDVSMLKPGIYFLEVVTKAWSGMTKFVKQ